MPELVPCAACDSLAYAGTCVCPHCGASKACHGPRLSRAAMALGLVSVLNGCYYDRVQSDYTAAVTDSSWRRLDEDGDGAFADMDCDDQDASVHPGAAEICNGVDDDCDGEVDEDAVDMRTFYADADGDGFGSDAHAIFACVAPEGTSAAGGDCDDADPARHPGATETPGDGVDSNCDGEDDT